MRHLPGFTSAFVLASAFAASGCSLDTRDASGSADPIETTGRVTQALPAPVPGVDISAQRAFVGDPLRGMGPGQSGSIYSLNADDAAGMASTTKSFTLLLAVEAVAKGTVSLDDIVTISTKAADIDNNHGGGGHSEAGLPAGEQVRFGDLLYAMMIPSGGDASIAIAQHVAVKRYPYLAAATAAEQEAKFTEMMNDRAAELGLEDTVFYNAYGGDHAHAADNTPGDSVPHVASTRDMAKWFDAGMKYPLFRTVAGFEGTYDFDAIDGTPYSYAQNFTYPGLRAQKGGSNTACNKCLVADARRLGRDLLVAYTQSEGGDGTTLFDYGFDQLFVPKAQAESATYTQGWAQSSLACVNGQRATSAVVRADGTLRMLLWGLDLEDGNISHLNPIVPAVVLPGTVVLQATRTSPPSDPQPTPSFIVATNAGTSTQPTMDDVTFGGPVAKNLKTRSQYAGNGNVVVVAETDQGVRLHSFGITVDNTIVQRDLEVVGKGSDARVFVLNAKVVVTAHRDETGKAVVKSWHLDAATGKLSNVLDTDVGPTVAPGEIELAGRAGLSAMYHLVLAVRTNTGTRQLRSYSVQHNNGAITYKDSTSQTGGSHLAFAHVPGYGTARDIYALAYRDGSGRLALESYEVASDYEVTRRGSRVDLLGGVNQIDADGTLRISAYQEGGVMVAFQKSPAFGVQRLEAWSLDSVGGTSLTITPNRVTTELTAANGLHGICRAATGKAEGDFLVATGKENVEGLKIRAFRSGPR